MAQRTLAREDSAHALARTSAAEAAALGLFAALAAALLLANLDNQYLWQDEAQTALLGRSVLEHGVPHGTDGRNSFSQELGAELGPGGIWRWHTWLSFYAVAAAFALLGESAFAARLPFALCGVACVVATGRLARELFRDRVAGAAAAGLLALSVPFLILARQARWYALAALLALLGLLAYGRIAPGRRGPTLGLFAASLLLFHTHFLYAAVLLLAVLVHAALFERARLRAVLAAGAATAALALPWVVWLSGVDLGGSYARRLASQAQALRFGRSYVAFLFGLFLAHGLPFAFALPLALHRRLRGGPLLPRDRALWSGLALVALHSALGVGLLALLAPGNYPRYLTPLLPPLFAVAGLAVGSLARASPTLAAAAVALWVASGPLDRFVHELTHDFDGPIEGIVRHLREHAHPGDRVAIVYGDMPLKFYTPLRVIGGLTGESLAEARGAEWIALRRHDVAPVNREVRGVLRAYLAGGGYVRHVLDYPDTAFENREDPRLHAYRTVERAPRVELWERRR